MVLRVRCGGLSQAHISRHLGIRLFGQGTSPGCDASYFTWRRPLNFHYSSKIGALCPSGGGCCDNIVVVDEDDYHHKSSWPSLGKGVNEILQ